MRVIKLFDVQIEITSYLVLKRHTIQILRPKITPTSDKFLALDTYLFSLFKKKQILKHTFRVLKLRQYQIIILCLE